MDTGDLRFKLRLEDDESGRHTRRLYEAIQARPSLYVDANATLAYRDLKPGEMSGSIPEAILFGVPALLAVPPFIESIARQYAQFRRSTSASVKATLTGPNGTVDLVGDFTPKQLETIYRGVLASAPDRDAPTEGESGPDGAED